MSDRYLCYGESCCTTYNSLSCQKELLSADQIIKRWYDDRTNFYYKQDKGVFPSDGSCKDQLLPGPIINRSSACVGCTLIRRLLKDQNVSSNERFSFDIDTGSTQGRRFIVDRTCRDSNLCKSYTILPCIKDIAKEVSTEVCNNTEWYSSDSKHINYAMISSIMEHEMFKASLPGIPTFRWLYTCSTYQYIVKEEYVSPKSLTVKQQNGYSKEVIVQLYKQLFSILHFLGKYAFVHSDPCIKHLNIADKDCAYNYEGVFIASKFTLHLDPVASSSITLYSPDVSKRFFYHTGKITSPITCLFDVVMKRVCDCKDYDCKCNLVPFCNIGKIDPFIGNVYQTYTVDLGIPVISSAYNACAFLLSSYIEGWFTEDCTDIMDIWKGLWLPQQYSSFMDTVNKYRGDNKINNGSFIRQLLSTVHIRYDACNYLWSRFSKL